MRLVEKTSAVTTGEMLCDEGNGGSVHRVAGRGRSGRIARWGHQCFSLRVSR